MTFTLPDLPYDRTALAPHMSAETLEFHHGKHHQAYVNALNDLTKGTDLAGKSLDDIVKATYGKEDRQAIFNNAGQHWNHILFWQCMKPKGGGAMPGELERRIKADLGGVDKFKEEFVKAGVGQFGSGWCWLVVNKGKLAVTKTPNGVNPLALGQHGLLGCDVWEHSYYLDYRNRRPDYIKAFLEHLVNWEFVAQRLAKA
ncbi:MAG: superoxide dismutase [Proteobacteria bacterium]|nr:superoxide dismutase [Pseudomonadota bacterium]